MSLTAQKWQDVMAMSTGVQYTLGPNATDRYLLDPKRIGFLFARYKFAAKMLRDCTSIIDVGCGDGMGSATFLEDTKATDIVGIDQDVELLSHAKTHLVPAINRARSDGERLEFAHADLLNDGHLSCYYEGLCCLDVIEHIDPYRSGEFVDRLVAMLADDGIAVIGTPNALAAQFASPQSQAGHINLFTPAHFRDALGKYFRHVFLFSMNDEIVHTGFDKLAHYLIALCIK